MISPEQKQLVEDYIQERGKTPYPVLWLELGHLQKELVASIKLQNSLTTQEKSIPEKRVKLQTLVDAIKAMDDEILRELTCHLSPTRAYIAMFKESLRSIHHQGLERESWPKGEKAVSPPKLGDRHLKDNLDLVLDETLCTLERSCQQMLDVLSQPKHGHYYENSYPHVLTRGGIRTYIAAGFRNIPTTETSELTKWLDYLRNDVFGHAKAIETNPYRKWIYHVAGKTRPERNAFEAALIQKYDRRGYPDIKQRIDGSTAFGWGPLEPD